MAKRSNGEGTIYKEKMVYGVPAVMYLVEMVNLKKIRVWQDTEECKRKIEGIRKLRRAESTDNDVGGTDA